MNAAQILTGQGMAFIPLTVGAPMGTPLGRSPCGGFVTIPLFRDWAIDLPTPTTERQPQPRAGTDNLQGGEGFHGEASK